MGNLKRKAIKKIKTKIKIKKNKLKMMIKNLKMKAKRNFKKTISY